ncbi:beta-L-arabinofuranosidase domain-containing protein [Microbacterium sp. NPDC019599]|uniref:beta-L-arabinofuranosidase domain-containing protein n=1 Tax=Microbacterium sp. NPDC019599 TaxID=3154690 RepID=UPI0033F7AB62
MQFFPATAVRLDGGAFADAVRTDLAYVRALDPDRLLAPFLTEAGLPPRAPGYPSWESEGLGGQTGGHYLSALSHLWAATGEHDLRARLEYMLDELARAQDAVGTGYVGGVPDGADVFAAVGSEGLPAALAFGQSPNWVPWYNLHKTFHGLLDAYSVAGIDRALDIVTRLADWWLAIAADVDDEAFETMLATEFGGMNEVFSRLAELTGRDEDAAMALRFSHRAILDPLLEGRDALTGLHANTQIPKAVGYAISPDDSIRAAADVFWRTVVDRRSTAIGGNSVREHFHALDDFSPMIEDREGPETCNTYNMLRLTRALAERELRPEHLDYAERALFNHVLSAQHPEHGGFVYFTPMRPRHYRVYSTVDECFWCCVGSGIENQARHGEWVFGVEDGALAVNLFVPATLDAPSFGGRVRIETGFPADDSVAVVLDLDAPRAFALRLRVPEWAPGLSDLAVDGEPLAGDAIPGAVVLDREWQPGARVTFRVPLTPRAEAMPDGSPWRAFLAGPIVLAARSSEDGLLGLEGDDERWSHIARGELLPLAGVPIVTEAAATELLTETAPLRYQLQTDAGDVELEPFAGIHDARYTVYWPVASDSDARRAELQEQDAALEVDAATLDRVSFGEQQPESDHAFEGPDSWIVSDGDRHARATRDRIAVTLRNPDGAGRTLRLGLVQSAEPTRLAVRVDGELVAFESFDAGEAEVELDVALGDAGRGEVVRLELSGAEGRSTPGIRSVRLLR